MIVGFIFINDIQTPVYWPTTGDNPVALNLGTGTVGFAYGINTSGLIVGYIFIDGSPIPVYWPTTGDDPVALSLGTGTEGGGCIRH